MGLFKRRADNSEEIEQLKSQIASMGARLEATDVAKQQLVDQVGGIAARLDTPPPPEPPPPPRPTVDPAELASVRARVDGLTSRVDELGERKPPPASDPAELDEIRSSIDRLVSRIDDVDRRITSISTELANQISELSGDLEQLGGNEPPTEQVVDELRDAQTRLANEQARYQIAFRQDMADLADRLRRH